MPNTKVVAVDFGAVFWTAWHASADQNISEAFSRTMRRVKEAARMGDCVAVCLDSPKSRRKETWSGYKADREAKPRGALEQMRRAIEALKALGIYTIQVDYCEGDDIVGMVTVWALDEGHDVLIYGADKDLYQLLRQDRVELVNHQTGEVFGESDLMAKAGIRPHQVPDFLALVGDKSDGLPGIDKCGPKKAALLLNEFGSVSGLYAALHDEATRVTSLPGVGPTLIANLLAAETREPSVMTVRSLATLAVEGEPGERIEFPGVLESTFPDDNPFDNKTIHPESKTMSDQVQPAPSDSAVINAELESPRPTTASPGQDRRRSTSMVRREVAFERQLEPTSLDGAYQLAEALFQSGFFGVRNKEGVFTLMIAGRSYGLDVFQSVNGFSIIKGRPAMTAGMMHALCLRHPDCVYIHWVESTLERAIVETKRRNDPEPTRFEWTIEDAKRANLLGKDNWDQYPKSMLRARCIADMGRAVFPDAVHNTYLADELGEDVAETA